MANVWRAWGGAAAIGVGGALIGREGLHRRRKTDLRGQVALITGGSRGLGLAIARELASEGCQLALCARDAEELAVAAQELRELGADVLSLMCDVRVEQEVNAMVANVEEHFGRIDLLFTVAGIIDVARVDDLTSDDFRRSMDVMFWGTLYPILAVLPGMRARKYGRIATVASIGGKISVPHLMSYSAAKFAAVGLSEGLSTELSGDGITVTTIVPGLMRTGSHIKATFTGSDDQQRADYAWFSVGATSPLAPRADRAARIIVRSVKRGETQRIFPFPFVLASGVHGVAPATTVRMMRLVNSILPSHPGDITTQKGEEIERELDSRAHELLTKLGMDVEYAFNRHVGEDLDRADGGSRTR